MRNQLHRESEDNLGSGFLGETAEVRAAAKGAVPLSPLPDASPPPFLAWRLVFALAALFRLG